MHQKNGVVFATTRLATSLRVHCAEQGNPRGEAIIFLHAYVDSWFSFSRVLPLLSPCYHAFAFDQRGHGDSEKPQCCYTVDDYAADVEACPSSSGSSWRARSTTRYRKVSSQQRPPRASRSLPASGATIWRGVAHGR